MATAAVVGEATAAGEETEMADESTGDGEERASFAEVRRKRKRKLKSLEMEVDGGETAAKRPSFPPVGAAATPVRHNDVTLRHGGCGLSLSCVQGGRGEFRSVSVPPNRFSPLKENWMKIFSPIVEHLKLQIRLNLKKRHVELRVSGGGGARGTLHHRDVIDLLQSSKFTKDPGAIQKAADFVQAFMLGFDVEVRQREGHSPISPHSHLYKSCLLNQLSSFHSQAHLSLPPSLPPSLSPSLFLSLSLLLRRMLWPL